MDLDGVLDELYGAPPERFTARRDELARQARADGDKDLAATVHALRRPTAAAWVVNCLARQAPDAVGGLVELGVRMREAQSVLSGSQMRTLSRERQQVLADLVRRAAALAAGPVSPSVSQEVEETLRAAVSDEDAAAAVRSGCLTHGLSYSGLGPVDTSTATARHLHAVPGTASHEEPGAADEKPDDGSGGKSGKGAPETAERVDPREEERRRQHERELAEAESALRSSERAAAAAAARAGRARQRAEEAQEEVAERERAWQAAREASDRAGATLEAAVEQAEAAEGVARAAREEVERVRSASVGS